MNKLSTLGLLALALSGCQRSEVRPEASGSTAFTKKQAQGQIIRSDVTYDEHSQHPQVRWIVQLATPLTLKGRNNQDYTQVKVFTLPRTTKFRVGTRIKFTYKVVPLPEQTPWKTGYEWTPDLSYSPGYTPNPELMLAAVQLCR